MPYTEEEEEKINFLISFFLHFLKFLLEILFLRILNQSFYSSEEGVQIGLLLSFDIKLMTSATKSFPLYSPLILLKFS